VRRPWLRPTVYGLALVAVIVFTALLAAGALDEHLNNGVGW
jgi:hypothetical protein